MGTFFSAIFNIILFVAAIAFYVWLLILLPRNMAKKRGRNPVGWTILFWILSPFWGAILLLILGDSKEKIRQDILDGINRNKNEEQNDE